MRRLVPLALLLASTALAASARTTDNLNLRATASTSGRVLLVIPNGTKLNVTTCAGSWCRTIYRGRRGYVSRRFLSVPVPSGRGARSASVAEPSVTYANCSYARNVGAAPMRRGELGYSRALDPDADGVACE